jgi:hypothetical protein
VEGPAAAVCVVVVASGVVTVFAEVAGVCFRLKLSLAGGRVSARLAGGTGVE